MPGSEPQQWEGWIMVKINDLDLQILCCETTRESELKALCTRQRDLGGGEQCAGWTGQSQYVTTSMDKSMILMSCSEWVAMFLRATIYSWETLWIVVSKLLKHTPAAIILIPGN